MQPWCLDCGASEDLCADHIIPLAVAPELAMTAENVTVRCRACNGRRADRYSVADAQGVVDALRRSVGRRPSAGGRERLAVAERALAGVGGAPKPAGVPPRGKAQSAMKWPNQLHHNDLQNPIPTDTANSGDTAAFRGQDGVGA